VPPEVHEGPRWANVSWPDSHALRRLAAASAGTGPCTTTTAARWAQDDYEHPARPGTNASVQARGRGGSACRRDEADTLDHGAARV